MNLCGIHCIVLIVLLGKIQMGEKRVQYVELKEGTYLQCTILDQLSQKKSALNHCKIPETKNYRFENKCYVKRQTKTG